jgi:GNAT superfamily N-acetyltransferase
MRYARQAIESCRPRIGRERIRDVIRDASEADWAAIWPFFHAITAAGETFAYDRDLSAAAAKAMWMAGPPSRTVVAVDQADGVLGSASMHPNRGGPGAHVASASFMVDPRQQGRGVGRALVEHTLDWARQEGYRAMQFNGVVESNARAVALYRSLGFVVIGTVPEGFNHPVNGYVGLHVMYRSL